MFLPAECLICSFPSSQIQMRIQCLIYANQTRELLRRKFSIPETICIKSSTSKVLFPAITHTYVKPTLKDRIQPISQPHSRRYKSISVCFIDVSFVCPSSQVIASLQLFQQQQQQITILPTYQGIVDEKTMNMNFILLLQAHQWHCMLNTVEKWCRRSPAFTQPSPNPLAFSFTKAASSKELGK